MPKPSGEWLQDDMHHYRSIGIDTIVSMLERDEVHELGLQDEQIICKQNQIDFIQLAVPDRSLPAYEAFLIMMDLVVAKLKRGETVAVHCRPGIGRSGIVVCCALLYFGNTPEAAVEIVSKARGVLVPDTKEQRDFIDLFEIELNKDV